MRESAEHVVASTFGFAVVDQARTPVGGKLVVTRTRDGSQSFEVLTRGLPDQFAYDLVFRHDPRRDLAFGSTTGNVFASRDRGDSWSAVSHHLPPVHTVTFAVA